MSFFKKYKGIIVIVIVILIVAFAYINFFPRNDSNELLSAEGVGLENALVGRGLLSILLDLRGLKLDPSIFDDRSFQGLRDFSVNIPPQKSGRNNPFLPI